MPESPWPKIEEGVRKLRNVECEDEFICKIQNPSLSSVSKRWSEDGHFIKAIETAFVKEGKDQKL